MKKRTVITNTPIKLPINTTMLYAFLLYYFKVDDLYCGIAITIAAIYWIAAIAAKWNEEQIDLFDEKTDNEKQPKKSAFAEKLDKMAEERIKNRKA